MGLFNLFHKKQDINQVYELMRGLENAVLLDVRTAEEFAEGHLPQAVNLPLQSIAVQAQSALPQKDIPLFVYCRSGVRSAKAAAELRQMGFACVQDMGGILSYKGRLEV